MSVTRKRPSTDTSTLASLWILLSRTTTLALGSQMSGTTPAFALKSHAWMRYVRWELSETWDSALRRMFQRCWPMKCSPGLAPEPRSMPARWKMRHGGCSPLGRLGPSSSAAAAGAAGALA